MKKLLVIMLVLSIASIATAAIISTEGEQKISRYLKQMHSRAEATGQDLTRVYNDAKDYVIAHPTQFTAADKTKLNGLQPEITATIDAINALILEIETEFSGLNE